MRGLLFGNKTLLQASRVLSAVLILVISGYYLAGSGSGVLQTWTTCINRGIIRASGNMYAPLADFQEEHSFDSRRMLFRMASMMIPIDDFVLENQGVEAVSEDVDTKELILALQEQDENSVDSDGKLVVADTVTEEQKEKKNTKEKVSVEKLKDFDYLKSKYYTVDSTTSISRSELDAEAFLKKDMTIEAGGKEPKILLYHTHSQEAFADSKKGDAGETIVGMGDYLAKLLTEKYHIPVLHHKGVYDLIDGRLDRSQAYELAKPDIQKILKENPSIEVIIDLHRDGVAEGTHLVTEIDGKKTAKIMFFNGLSRTNSNGNIGYLSNPYIQDNLAFSLQMELKAEELYPDFTRKIYLKSYRYNMHFMPKTLLIEAGAQTNTVQEEKNAMEPLAEILASVLIP